MAQSRRPGGIEIEQDLEFQRRSWKVQRVAWIVMLLVVIGAILGVFGNGPLSNASAGDSDAFRVDYQRFVRLDSPEKISFNIGPRPDSSVTLWLDREWLRNHNVNSIVPEPRETSVDRGRVLYEFMLGPSQPSKIEFDLETKGYGRIRGHAGLIGGPAISFGQLSYF